MTEKAETFAKEHLPPEISGLNGYSFLADTEYGSRYMWTFSAGGTCKLFKLEEGKVGKQIFEGGTGDMSNPTDVDLASLDWRDVGDPDGRPRDGAEQGRQNSLLAEALNNTLRPPDEDQGFLLPFLRLSGDPDYPIQIAVDIPTHDFHIAIPFDANGIVVPSFEIDSEIKGKNFPNYELSKGEVTPDFYAQDLVEWVQATQSDSREKIYFDKTTGEITTEKRDNPQEVLVQTNQLPTYEDFQRFAELKRIHRVKERIKASVQNRPAFQYLQENTKLTSNGIEIVGPNGETYLISYVENRRDYPLNIKCTDRPAPESDEIPQDKIISFGGDGKTFHDHKWIGYPELVSLEQSLEAVEREVVGRKIVADMNTYQSQPKVELNLEILPDPLSDDPDETQPENTLSLLSVDTENLSATFQIRFGENIYDVQVVNADEIHILQDEEPNYDPFVMINALMAFDREKYPDVVAGFVETQSNEVPTPSLMLKIPGEEETYRYFYEDIETEEHGESERVVRRRLVDLNEGENEAEDADFDEDTEHIRRFIEQQIESEEAGFLSEETINEQLAELRAEVLEKRLEPFQEMIRGRLEEAEIDDSIIGPVEENLREMVLDQEIYHGFFRTARVSGENLRLEFFSNNQKSRYELVMSHDGVIQLRDAQGHRGQEATLDDSVLNAMLISLNRPADDIENTTKIYLRRLRETIQEKPFLRQEKNKLVVSQQGSRFDLVKDQEGDWVHIYSIKSGTRKIPIPFSLEPTLLGDFVQDTSVSITSEQIDEYWSKISNRKALTQEAIEIVRTVSAAD